MDMTAASTPKVRNRYREAEIRAIPVRPPLV